MSIGILRLVAAAALAVSGSFLTSASGAPTQPDIPLTIQSGTVQIMARVPFDTHNVRSALEVLGVSTNNTLVIPSPDAPLAPELHITLLPQHVVSIKDGDKPLRQFTTFATYVGAALIDAGVSAAATDKTDPDLTAPVTDNILITVTRISELEEKQVTPIPFPVHIHDDPALPWREERVLQNGKPGVAEEIVHERLENGVVVKRSVISRRVLEEPVPEERARGTLIRIGKTIQGKGSWYSYRPGNFAAATAFPRGAWLRVTNLENGRTNIVQVNDYGPFVPGRIIDLEATAFRQLAPRNQGVIPVQVEQILQ